MSPPSVHPITGLRETAPAGPSRPHVIVGMVDSFLAGWLIAPPAGTDTVFWK